MKFLIILFFLSLNVQAARSNPLDVYDKTMEIVSSKFYDQTFRGLPWKNLVREHRTMLSKKSSDLELSFVINSVLSKLNASHTAFLLPTMQDYWGLKSIFSGQIDGAKFFQIGAWFTQINGKWFIRNVFEGSPADEAGLLAGDEVLEVDGVELQPVDSFKEGKRAVLKIKRGKKGKSFEVVIHPAYLSLQRSLLEATKKSFSIVQRDNKKIAYFHLWSGTHVAFKAELQKAAFEASKFTDAFILDLRDGFGGAYPEYIDPFLKEIYTKPLVVLINDGVRSGKEWITYILKQNKRATLIGTRTKGYFLAGQPFEIDSNRFLLYLAVHEDPEMPKLEHNGVKPDFEIQQALPYSSGVDAQLAFALKFLANK